jgi:hypothetical protein
MTDHFDVLCPGCGGPATAVAVGPQKTGPGWNRNTEMMYKTECPAPHWYTMPLHQLHMPVLTDKQIAAVQYEVPDP